MELSGATRTEKGQTLLLFVLALAVLIGFVAMAIDVGLLYEDRRHLQNTADAAALAGVAELPSNPALAKQKAEEWAVNNGVSSSEIKSVEVRTTDFPNDTLFVEVETSFDWVFGRVLGMTSDNVGASAAARMGSYAGGHNMMPWAILQGDSTCLDATGKAIFGMTCAVKVGAQDGIGGWRGALDFDGNGGGSSEYRDNIVDGDSDWSYCISGQDPPPCHGTVDALPGNKVGGTGQGIEDRLLAEPTAGCDTNGSGTDDFVEVFAPTGLVTPEYSVACPNSPRLVIIPIVSYESTPIQTVTIRGWSMGYLKSYACVGDATCNGKGHWEVYIDIVDAAYSQSAGFLGAYDPASGILIRRLIQ